MREIDREVRRAIRNWIIQGSLGLIAYGLILFLAAGNIVWVWGWVLLVTLAAFLAAHPILLLPQNPELLAERQRGLRDQDVKVWDRWIAALAGGVMPIASWIVAGLDVRLGWTGQISLFFHLSGMFTMVLGYVLFLWAMVTNAYFAEGVRIQSERGHTVVTGGPYRLVRHPGYTGAILAQASTPLLLGSIWAVIPSLFFAFLYVLRTILEDKTLIHELPGYAEFAQQTRFRLIPWIW